MKINKIEISNLNGRTFSIDINTPITLFLAPNGVGKSTLVKALNIIFGDKPKDVLPGYAVQVTINDGIKLGVKKSLSKYTYYINNNTVAFEAYKKVLLSEATDGGSIASSEALRVTTTSELFNAAESESIMDYLLPHIGPSLNADRVVAFSPAASDLAEKQLRDVLPKMPERFDLSVLDEAYKKLSAKRRETNADLKALKTISDRLHPLPVKRTLSEVEAEENEFILNHKDMTDQISKMREYEQALKKAEDQKKVIAAYEIQIKEIDRKLNGNTATEEMKQKIEEVKEKAIKSKAEHSALMATLSKDIDLIKNTLINLDKPVCPISQKLICTTDKTGVKKELQESLKENEDSFIRIKKAFEKDISILDKCTANEEKWEEFHKLEINKKMIQTSIEAFKKNPVVIPEKPVTILDSSSYDETLRKYKQEAQNIRDYEQKKEYEKSIEELSILSRTQDLLVKALDSKGEIKAQCVEICIEDINKMLEERIIEIMPGFELCLRPENGITVYAKTPRNTDWTPNSKLSSGEKIAVSIIMMDLINQMAPTNIMVIDNIEQLDRETLCKLRNMILSPEVALWYHNVFILGVDHKDVVEVFRTMEATRVTSSDVKSNIQKESVA